MATVKPDFSAMDGVHPKTDDFLRLQQSLDVMITSFSSFLGSGILYGMEPYFPNATDVAFRAGAVLLKEGFQSEIVRFNEGELVISGGRSFLRGKNVYIYKKVTATTVETRLDEVGQTKIVAYSPQYEVVWDPIPPVQTTFLTKIGENPLPASPPPNYALSEFVRQFAIRSVVHTNQINADGTYSGQKINGNQAIVAGSVLTAQLGHGSVTSDKILDGTIQTQDIGNLQVTTEKLADNAVTTTKILDDAITTDKLAPGAVTADKLSSNAVPVGTIIAYAGAIEVNNSIDEHFETTLFGGLWMRCDGRTLSKASYPELWVALRRNPSSIYGVWGDPISGGPTTQFRIPDLRGMFLRCVDNGIGRDPDRGSRRALYRNGNTGDNVASWQGSIFGSHRHFSADGANTRTGAFSDNDFADWCDGDSAVQSPQSRYTSSEGGNETRPLNVNVYYIIKVK